MKTSSPFSILSTMVVNCHRILVIFFFQWSTFRIIRLFQALQEFCELCSKEDNIEVVKTSEAGMLLIMPYWPRLYMRLSNDQDRRVREMAQKAHWVGKYTLRHFLYWSRLPIIFLRLIPKLCWLTKSRLRHSIWKSVKNVSCEFSYRKLTFDVTFKSL